MVAEQVEDPWLKGIVFRYLLAHAEDPSRASGSGISAIERFSKKAPFYDKFIKMVIDKVPKYDEKRLLDTGADVSQQDFKAILSCFKELSGVWNPFHYTVFGRVIPAVQDKVTKMASAVGVTALGPSIVISSSPRYNDDFNSDQELVIERKPQTRRGITEATIQHYLLPSVSEPYLEMITAGLGYFEGLTRLFKWRNVGKTKILDLPFTLDELIERDLAYANLEVEYKEGGTVFIGGKNKEKTDHGKKAGLQELLDKEPIDYKEEFLSRDLASFELDDASGYDGRPIIIETPFEIDGEILIPAGRYGMPCARYTVSIPTPNVFKRLLWAGLSLFSKKEDEYLFLDKTDEAIEASDEANRDKLQVERTHKAEKEALLARADLAEADLARVRAEVEARDTAQELGNAVRLTQDVYTLAKGIGHDLRSHASKQIDNNKATLEKLLSIAKKEMDYVPDIPLFEDNGEIKHTSLKKLSQDSSTPEPFKMLLGYVLRTETRADLIHATATSLMEEIIDSSGKVVLGYNDLIPPIVKYLDLSYDNVDITFEPNDEIQLYGSKPSLQTTLLNLITNAADASLNSFEEGDADSASVHICASELGHMSAISISQTGLLSRQKALELSSGEKVESTREGGTGNGSQVAYSVIKASGGGIRYRPTMIKSNASIRILLPHSEPEEN